MELINGQGAINHYWRLCLKKVNSSFFICSFLTRTLGEYQVVSFIRDFPASEGSRFMPML